MGMLNEQTFTQLNSPWGSAGIKIVGTSLAALADKIENIKNVSQKRLTSPE
jgi:hypothetical protein